VCPKCFFQSERNEIYALAGNTRGGDLEAKVVASVQETVRSTDDYAPIGQHWKDVDQKNLSQSTLSIGERNELLDVTASRELSMNKFLSIIANYARRH
jgi:hypothetical protein